MLKIPNAQWIHFRVLRQLIFSLTFRFKLLDDRKDFHEIMQLFPAAANDTHAKIPDRFGVSCQWARVARASGHTSISTAYDNAISLMQETLTFAPTLEIQHSHLVTLQYDYETLPLDHASYLIHIGQLRQAIETLERGRVLLLSELHGFRTSIDHLRALDLPLAAKFVALNRDLEALTTSVTPVVWINGGADGGKGVDPLGHLVTQQRKLLRERGALISRIQALPGFETFLAVPSFETLQSAAADGPVIVINHSKWRSDILILLCNSPPSLLPTSDGFYDRVNNLRDQLLAARKKNIDSKEYEDALSSVLKSLYDLIGKPVLDKLRELNVSEQSRVWWCPTSVFYSLPLHAMGPIRSNGSDKLYFSDLYISSYTPTLTTLIEARKRGMRTPDKPSVLLVAQPGATLPGALKEMRIVQTVCPSVTALTRKMATPPVVLERLRDHRFAHISCHGNLEIGKPFDASFKLYRGNLTLLDIVRSQLSTAEFAFLSACHTAEVTEGSIADEALHLTAALQYCGFRSVVGTMWAMADVDGPKLARKFYSSVFSDGWDGIRHYERTAKALRDAVSELRRERGMTLERWVNFVHYGA
jgi:CHAT domain-containing protein